MAIHLRLVTDHDDDGIPIGTRIGPYEVRARLGRASDSHEDVPEPWRDPPEPDCETTARTGLSTAVVVGVAAAWLMAFSAVAVSASTWVVFVLVAAG